MNIIEKSMTGFRSPDAIHQMGHYHISIAIYPLTSWEYTLGMNIFRGLPPTGGPYILLSLIPY